MRWQVSLAQVPEIKQIGVATHGWTPVERYHLDMYCVHFYRYHARLRVNDYAFAVEPGHMTICEPGSELVLEYSQPGCQHAYSLFQLHDGAEHVVSLPLVQALGDLFPRFFRAMQRTAALARANPQWAAIRLWELLYELSALTPNGEAHSALVERAVAIIDQRLNERIYIADLAKELGCSHNHLTRQFKAHLGSNVTRYIQRRRLERAKELMQYSDMPIKAIAVATGPWDLQQFNKFVRLHTGASPRTFRNRIPAE